MVDFKKNYFQRRTRDRGPRSNNRINALEVQVISNDGKNLGVIQTKEAIQIAKDEGLDLIEISPNAKPPVCKIIDYKKFLYDQKKKQKEIKAKAQKIVLKEIRFGPNTDDHDFEFKTKHARKFIEEGCKVKAFVFFKGRTIIFKDRGQILLLKLAQELEDIAVVEALPKMDGKRMFMYLSPKKKK